MQANSNRTTPQPSPSEQAEFYTAVHMVTREREFSAAKALLDLGADWHEITACLNSQWPVSSEPQYLNSWAVESLNRLHAQYRRGPAAGLEQ